MTPRRTSHLPGRTWVFAGVMAILSLTSCGDGSTGQAASHDIYRAFSDLCSGLELNEHLWRQRSHYAVEQQRCECGNGSRSGLDSPDRSNCEGRYRH